MESFNYDKFESLSGLELELFFNKAENQVGLNESFLKYVKNKAMCFDEAHLAMAICLLGKLKTTEAYREISIYLDHPNLSIRFPAIKILSNFEDYENIDTRILNDNIILEKIQKVVEEHGGWSETKELKEILKRKTSIQ